MPPTKYIDSQGHENVLPDDASNPVGGMQPLETDAPPPPALAEAAFYPPPAPVPTAAADSDDGAPPLLSSGEQALYLIVLVLFLCCLWSNFKPQVLKLMECVLGVLAVIPPLRGPAEAALESLSHRPMSPADDITEVEWTNEDADPMRVDGSAELLDSEMGSDLASPRHDPDEDEDDDDEEAPLPPPEPKASRGKKGSKKQAKKEPKSKQRRREEEEDEEEAMFSAQQAATEEKLSEVRLDDDEEVEEVDEDEGVSPYRSRQEGAPSPHGGDDHAMAARLFALETKIKSGGTVTLDDLQGARARVSVTGDFLPAVRNGGRADPAAASSNDDSFTMVGLNRQVLRKQTRPSPARLRADADRRQAKLEEALRAKQEESRKAAQQQDELKKADARRTLQKELLMMDHEIDARSTRVGDSATGQPPSQMLAAKWLLEHAYSRYPPRTFTKRRAAEEVMRARELRFRDATMNELKLMQARYAPDKNTVDEFGAEWAVLAEEIAKHAFSLCSGINRGGTQDKLSPFAGGGLFTQPRLEDGDEIGFSLAGGERELMMEEEDVEDAD